MLLTLGTSQVHFDWPTERPKFARITADHPPHDGDTIFVDIDMDLKDWKHDYPLRLDGCNAWEVGTEAGKAARDNLRSILTPGLQVVLTTIKDYKYGGEFVARVWLMDGTELVPSLIAAQWLAPWDGRGKAPTPPWPRTV